MHDLMLHFEWNFTAASDHRETSGRTKCYHFCDSFDHAQNYPLSMSFMPKSIVS
ncbi:hypothetical protein BDZ85DRAFT_2404 [Elsinoe ampelina]|uniref:Uncharacterized protein n=1 Tax=Elsinoe ampelina TaxID=302913 RepID=A0A6A6GNW6_9PEZI|nr:hypothetical protein BDZ85DRAFT_2404 [Elsinoe ampelina]